MKLFHQSVNIAGLTWLNLAEQHNYTEDSIRSLDWKEHIRLRPGMYIGKLGDGSAKDDGIYVLVKEVVDSPLLMVTVGLAFMAIGLARGTPGALRVGTIYVLWPLLYTVLVSGVAEEYLIEGLTRVLVFATIVLLS